MFIDTYIDVPFTLGHMVCLCMCVCVLYICHHASVKNCYILTLFLKKSKSQLLKAHLLDLTDTEPDICSTREHQARERIRYGIMHHMILYIMYHMISYIMHHIMLLLFSYTEGHWSANTPIIYKT